jgi:hypothetical protein
MRTEGLLSSDAGSLRWTWMLTELEEVPNVDRRRLGHLPEAADVDWVDEQNGKWERGRIVPADRRRQIPIPRPMTRVRQRDGKPPLHESPVGQAA